jgi:hypothetical protein
MKGRGILEILETALWQWLRQKQDEDGFICKHIKLKVFTIIHTPSI